MLLKVGVVMMSVALAFAAVGTAVALLDEPMPKRTIVAKPTAEPSVEPLQDRSYLPPRPQPIITEIKAHQEHQAPEVEPQQKHEAPVLQPQQKRVAPKPEPLEKAQFSEPAQPRPEPETLPIARDDWPAPTDTQLAAANEPRHYELPPGAIMGLTIKALGLYNVPVFDSDSQWALDNGVSHMPETSLPWSHTPQRNVYLAGHRLGWPGTGSHLVFYNLDKLGEGEEVILKDREGHKYTYRVSETFITDPGESWVMGQVVGRDMVTLQTCTPIPVFDKRLIVRADRV